MSSPPELPHKDPEGTATQTQIADELARGGHVAFAHEWLPAGVELATWQRQVATLCHARGALAEFATDLRTRVTIIMNTAAMPTLDQIEHAIAQIRRPTSSGQQPGHGRAKHGWL